MTLQSEEAREIRLLHLIAVPHEIRMGKKKKKKSVNNLWSEYLHLKDFSKITEMGEGGG